MNHYLIRFKPCRDTFLADSTPEEDNIIGQHFDYLKSLLNEKKLILAGRTDDAEIGIVIFMAKSETEAEAVLENDPAIKNKVFIGTVKLFRLALIKD